MAGVTLDTGALIAADRGDRRFFVWWKRFTRTGHVATVPAPVIAQAWRGAACARLGQVLSGCRPVAMDASLARQVGELCARADAADVVDAFVVLCAARRNEDVLTGDGEDLRRLAAHAPGVGRVVALDELPP